LPSVEHIALALLPACFSAVDGFLLPFGKLASSQFAARNSRQIQITLLSAQGCEAPAIDS